MLGSMIISHRKRLGMTQEQLAQKLEVTNQAVSKWETDQCCPDTMLLPKLADVLEITIDQLFGRETVQETGNLPWEADDAFHVVMYHGHRLLGHAPSDCELTFEYDGPAKDIYCAINLSCGDVAGNAKAGGYIECGDVGGNADAGGYVECSDVGGGVKAGSYVECSDVEGDLNSASYVECGDVGGSVNAMSYVECGDVGGNVTAGSYVECGDVGGGVTGGGQNGSGFHFNWGFGKK